MNKGRLLVWILFLSTLLFMRGRSWYANQDRKVYDIVKLELATADTGRTMLKEWKDTMIGKVDLVRYATVDTYADFLFIAGYTALLVMVSRQLGRSQRQRWLKYLLRWCLPMAILAGLLDVAENIILLMNMSEYETTFTSTRYVAGPKFILIGIVLVIWLVSFLARLLQAKKSNTFTR